MIPDSFEQEKTFHGHTFKHVYVKSIDWDPSWWSFDDERDVRNELWTIGPGDVVFDIGAAYGSYTLCALACGAARVFAWSPQGHPGASVMEADFMRESLALNGWSDRVKIYQDGLYSKTGWLDARTQEFLTIEPARLETGRYDNNDMIAVRTLNDWADQEFTGKYPPLHPGAKMWMKLDVEGAEVDILTSSVRFIAAHSPNVFVENHNFKNAAIEGDIRALMTSLGYREVATRPYGAITHSLYVP
jgi:FkbM family methyltransferase